MVETDSVVTAEREIVVDAAPGPECDDFVRQTPGARLCHAPAWTCMVERAFGHEGIYLVARAAGRVCGVLPLTHVRSRLFGDRLISQPFSDYGGPVAARPEAREALYRRAVEVAREYGCESLELRNTVRLPYDLHVRTDKISMCLPLAADPQEVWKGLRHKTRNRIRKAQGAGFVVLSGGLELLDEFYRMWTIRMHELGTPCYPRRLFTCILETFPQMTRIFLARLNGTTAAGLFAYTFKGWVQSSWGAALRPYDNLGPNYVLNWTAIEHYCQEGMKWFDFGRSTVGSGQHIFKERWGADPINLCWQYWTPGGREPSFARPEDPKYRRKVELWKRMPLWVSRVLGPVISPALP
ncbi:MAG: FemAB family PEP-CTERM system-associated protein [Planctomycetes bacterium]|nr:FemAB family PEP-CTERM system-associated protein [Planctomycetota bacterium]